MALFKSEENKVKCGRCGTEFDLNKNKDRCPLCGFGKENMIEKEVEFIPIQTYPKKETITINLEEEYITIPPELQLKSGEILVNEETKIWGSWLMFNDFFAPKFLARVLAWEMNNKKKDWINLELFMNNSINIIRKYRLSKLKGFPNLNKDAKGGRLVNHFLITATKMGLFEARSINKGIKNVWNENWKNIEIRLTKEGLEFARIKNSIFDEKKEEQILTKEEKKWLINHLKQIDKEGYKEYSNIKEIYEFLKAGHNGNKDLWNWFENNKKFRDYILRRSKRAIKDPKIFQKQLKNYARTFASAKISLLRELGVVRNKRSDYTIIGELE